MSKQDSRAGQLNAVIDVKLLFLAKLAARYKDQTLVEFIEDALRRALSPAAMQEDEPNVTEPAKPIQPTQSLWMEDLCWVDTGKPDHDDATRLFIVATKNVNLLAPKQRALFHHIVTELTAQGKKATLKNFVNFIDYSKGGE
jgi:hypothetical protein